MEKISGKEMKKIRKYRTEGEKAGTYEGLF